MQSYIKVRGKLFCNGGGDYRETTYSAVYCMDKRTVPCVKLEASPIENV